MAPKTLVLDASVGVKWFSGQGESDVPQARSILLEHARGNIDLIVPELFFHEISNALIHKRSITTDKLMQSVSTLAALKLSLFAVTAERLTSAVQLARVIGITEYDAFYAVAAIDNNCPLVSANPRHHKDIPGCQVIPISNWHE